MLPSDRNGAASGDAGPGKDANVKLETCVVTYHAQGLIPNAVKQ